MFFFFTCINVCVVSVFMDRTAKICNCSRGNSDQYMPNQQIGMLSIRWNEMDMSHIYSLYSSGKYYQRPGNRILPTVKVFDDEVVLIFSIPCICSQVLCMFLSAILQRLGEECYHIWRVILINENLFVTHRGYGRLITKDQNKGEGAR